MNLSISGRALVRAISYLTAGVLVLAGFTWKQSAAANDYRLQLENTYTRSLGELSAYLTNIADDLDKGKYIGTGGQLSLLSARIWRESGGAKSALSTLPVSDLHMDNTYKFLSQVGDYAMTLSKKMSSGQPLSEEERKNAEALRLYAGKLRDYVDGVQQQIRDGQIDIAAELVTAGRSGRGRHGGQSGDDTEGTKVSGLANGFEDTEQTMTGYPTLIYDGPFSDHLLNQKPRMTRYLPLVSPEDAQTAAARAARMQSIELVRGDDENSNMPSYTFTGGHSSIGVTKAGGVVTYLINSRDVAEERIRRDAMYERAQTFLEEQGIKEMRATYFETSDGICTINYAAVENGVILYPDLIKVGVALDDGSIVFYDARGYINNHRERSLEPPAITATQASESVSPALSIQSNRLTLIPTSGQNEVLTYEFHATAKDDPEQHLLVYVNAATGAEEKILLLIQTEYGTLTK